MTSVVVVSSAAASPPPPSSSPAQPARQRDGQHHGRDRSPPHGVRLAPRTRRSGPGGRGETTWAGSIGGGSAAGEPAHRRTEGRQAATGSGEGHEAGAGAGEGITVLLGPADLDVALLVGVVAVVALPSSVGSPGSGSPVGSGLASGRSGSIGSGSGCSSRVGDRQVVGSTGSGSGSGSGAGIATGQVLVGSGPDRGRGPPGAARRGGRAPADPARDRCRGGR